MEKRSEFKLRFVDKKMGDWKMILRTTEPVTEEEVRNLIDIHADILHGANDVYSPVDILDRIREDKGWDWEDMDWQEMLIVEW